jgi:hypothetical protein
MKIMKHTLGGLLILAIVGFSSCKPELKEIGPAYAAGEGIYGTWEIAEVNQIDLTQPIPESRNISSYLLADASRLLQLNFSKEGNSYTVPQPGILPRILGTAGTWKYDTLPFPTTLYFYTSNNDTVVAPLKNMPRENDVFFGFNLTRSDSCGTNYVRYEYNFKRLN